MSNVAIVVLTAVRERASCPGDSRSSFPAQADAGRQNRELRSPQSNKADRTKSFPSWREGVGSM
jgi:hypothetical protein